MSRYILSPEARSDLLEIDEYLSLERGSEAAATVMESLESLCQTIADMPQMGRERPELSPGLRSFTKRNYIVFYRLIQGGVQIARVYHGARDIKRLFSEEE